VLLSQLLNRRARIKACAKLMIFGWIPGLARILGQAVFSFLPCLKPLKGSHCHKQGAQSLWMLIRAIIGKHFTRERINTMC